VVIVIPDCGFVVVVVVVLSRLWFGRDDTDDDTDATAVVEGFGCCTDGDCDGDGDGNVGVTTLLRQWFTIGIPVFPPNRFF
jgi:hypothetical protein